MVYAIEAVLGIAFGFVLQKAGLGEYRRIIDQFRLKDFTMMSFMMCAIAVGAVLFAALAAAGVVGDSAAPAGYVAIALVGGAVLGAGMALCGMCPGTIAAGIGRGCTDYLVPGILGLVAGAIAYGAIFEPVILPWRYETVEVDGSLAALLGLSPWVLVVVIVAATVALYAILKRAK